jgi:hypothetical protein
MLAALALPDNAGIASKATATPSVKRLDTELRVIETIVIEGLLLWWPINRT